MGIVYMGCGSVSVPLRVGEFGESQMGAPDLETPLGRGKGLQHRHVMSLSLCWSPAYLGNTAQSPLSPANAVLIPAIPVHCEPRGACGSRLVELAAQEIRFPETGQVPAVELPEPKLTYVLDRLLKRSGCCRGIAVFQIGVSQKSQCHRSVERIWRMCNAAVTRGDACLPFASRCLD